MIKKNSKDSRTLLCKLKKVLILVQTKSSLQQYCGTMEDGRVYVIVDNPSDDTQQHLEIGLTYVTSLHK